MARVPEPERTPEGLAYEGRLLDRQDEEVVDQGAPFDIGTLLGRRRALGVLGIGLGALTLAACGGAGAASDSGTASAAPGSEIPDETAGPYPGDGSNGPDVLGLSGIVRSDIRTSIGSTAAVDGVPLTFTLSLTDMAGGAVPFAGAAVYAWHCDAQGRYSMYSSGVENENWLRGVQVADSRGEVTFTSVVPGCYAGRWPHIHFEVYPDVGSITDGDSVIATSQLALPKDLCTAVYARDEYSGSSANLSRVSLDSDTVFGDDGGRLQLATVSGSVARGYSASLAVPIDTGTEPTGGGAPGGGAPSGGAPGGGPGDGAAGPDGGSDGGGAGPDGGGKPSGGGMPTGGAPDGGGMPTGTPPGR